MLRTNMRFLAACFCTFLLGSSIARGQDWNTERKGITCHLVTNWFSSGHNFARTYKIDFESWNSSDEKDAQPKSSRHYQLTFSVSNAEAIPGFDYNFFAGPTAPGLHYKLLVLRAMSKGGKEVTFPMAPAGGYSAEMEGAFFFSSDADDPIEKLLRCISEGFETFSVSVYSLDKTRKEPLISVTCETKYMRAAVKEFLDGCPSRSDGGGCSQVPSNKQKVTKGVTMPINHDEIIDEIESHIRKFGGGFGEWCVGTAKDSRGPFFRRHLAADLGDGLAYREAFTTNAAQAVVDHLVNDRGLQLDQEAERRSALQGAVPESGKIVFVYRKTAPVPAAPPSDHAAFPRRAA